MRLAYCNATRRLTSKRPRTTHRAKAGFDEIRGPGNNRIVPTKSPELSKTAAPSLDRLALLPRSFYDRDPRKVSRELLGKLLVRRNGAALLAGRIVEVEAYLHGDPAAHSFIGRTTRNA